VAAIPQACGNSIAIDSSDGAMAVPSGAEVGTLLAISIYHPPYSSESVPATRFKPPGLIHPRQSAWDARGNLWVADDLAGKLFEFRPPFSETTQASAASSIAMQPAGLAIDTRANLLFVTDLGGDRMCAKTACHVYVVPSPYTGAPTATLTFAHEQPYAVAIDSSGRIFVALDTSPTTGVINVYSPPFTSNQRPAFSLDPGEPVRTLGFDPHGNLDAQVLTTGGIVEFDAPFDGSRSAPTLSIGCPAGDACKGPHNWAGFAFGP
jgi:hypothetical protein